MMRTFVIKAINAGLICAVLFGYQSFAIKRSKQIEEYEKEKAAAKKAWEMADKEKGEMAEIVPADGIYKGSGTGFGGEIQVQLEIREGEIFSAKVLSAEKETAEYLEAAKKVLTEVVEKQTAEVDTVSGATLSSNGILEGIRDALEDSNGKEKE